MRRIEQDMVRDELIVMVVAQMVLLVICNMYWDQNLADLNHSSTYHIIYITVSYMVHIRGVYHIWL